MAVRDRFDAAYRGVFRAGLTRLDAEAVHHTTVNALRGVSVSPRACAATAAARGTFAPELCREVFGRRVPAPVGVAAGFDKNGVAIDALAAFGFGFVEIGTVTALRQPGNPKPRLFRVPEDRAVVNRMGFNNDGAVQVAERLAARAARGASEVVLGVNIGKSKVTPVEGAVADYAQSAALLAPFADYLVVNVSSPNTPGLRDLQATAELAPIVRRVLVAAGDAAGRDVPLLVKIAPDLADDDVRAVSAMVVGEGAAGIIATNTTITRDGLTVPATRVAELGAGGLSGPMLAERSAEVLRLVRAEVDAAHVVISVGGVWTAEDAFARLAAGATLVQAYTAMIYEGPGWPSGVNHGVAHLMRERGMTSLDEVGPAR